MWEIFHVAEENFIWKIVVLCLLTKHLLDVCTVLWMAGAGLYMDRDVTQVKNMPLVSSSSWERGEIDTFRSPLSLTFAPYEGTRAKRWSTGLYRSILFKYLSNFTNCFSDWTSHFNVPLKNELIIIFVLDLSNFTVLYGCEAKNFQNYLTFK